MKKIKHLLPLLLFAVLLVGMMPFSAFAQEGASADPAEATPTPAAPGDIVPSGSIPQESESPDETSPPEGTAAPTATSAPTPTAELTPTATPTEAPEVDPPEVDPPSEDDPSHGEAHGDGIEMGPNNPPEDVPMMFAAYSNSATIAVRSCYDSSGNAINYAYSFQYDGRWVGGYGYPRHILYANNSPAYCLEPGKYLVGGSNVTKDAATVWNSFSSAKRDAIKLAILCGAEGNAANLSGSYGSKYTATQMIVWEFVVGVRSTTAPYSVSDNKVINSVCYNGANPEVKNVYNQIASAMAAYNTLPSFANPLAAPPPMNEMQYDNGTYTLTLTDANNVLSNYNVSCTDNNVQLSVNGNTLTMTSTVPVSGATINLTRKSTVSASSQIVAYGGSGLQETVVGIEAVGGTSGYFGAYTTGGPTPTPKPTPTPTPTPTPKGNVKIVKTSDDGKVSGITFTVTGGSVNQTVTSGSDGTITVPGLTPGSYTVTETVPAGYTADRASQSVTVRNGETATVNFHNTRKTGSVKIIKTSSDGKVSGIQFAVKGESVNQTVTSGSDGTITVPGLVPGQYTVTETVPDGYVCDNPTQTVTVEYDKTATVNFRNTLKTGNVKIIKTSDDGHVSGITFTVKGGRVNQTVTSGEDGTITVPGLVPGQYTVTESVPENYVCDNPSQTVTVEYDKTATVTFANKLKMWRVAVTKVDAEGNVRRSSGATLTGAVYGIYKDGELLDTYTIDDSYQFVTKLYPCGAGYELKEITPPPGYTLDLNSYPVGLEPGTVELAANDTSITVKETIIKGKLVIVKQDALTQAPLAGAVFTVYDETGASVTEGATGEDGTFTVDELTYGKYTAKETTPPDGYQLDETVFDFAIETDGQTVTLTRDNIYCVGSITVHKVDTQGNSLSGTVYLLEWSEDGSTWNPVTFRDGATPTIGGCTSLGLENGQLTTGEDGSVLFDGLVANGKVQYRLTETQTQPGLSLLKDPVFQGTLPLDGETEKEYDISFTVTNNRITTLPQTGSSGLLLPVTIGMALLGLAGCTGFFVAHNKKSKSAKENN